MTCPNCYATLSDTAKFCDQCGTPKSPPGDEAIALSIVNAWMVDSEYRSFDEMTSTDKRDARAMLAKARELLVAPLQAEVERLKADRDEAVEAMRVVAEASNANWTFMDRKRSVEEIVKLIATARTAAANARREALREARELAMVYLVNRPPAVDVFMVKLDALPRDASQPAAETQTCSEPGCGQCACQSSRVQTTAANARREALEEVAKDMILRMERPGTPRDHVDVYRMVKNTVLDMRDACQPAAETQTRGPRRGGAGEGCTWCHRGMARRKGSRPG